MDTFPTPNINKVSLKLVVSDDLSFSIKSNVNATYKNAFEKSIIILFNWEL